MKARLFVALRRETRRFLLVVLVASGALCGVVAVVFHRALEGAHALLIGPALALPDGPARWLAVVATPMAVGALLGFLVPRFSPQAGGGLTLVRTAYARGPERLDLRACLGTFLATPLSLGAGTPLGPEGPTVVLTSGVARGVARLLGLPARVTRGTIPVGAAAGIAAIFNTPITGVVFALEEVIGTASRGVLGGAIVAAVAAAVVEKNVLGGRHLLPASPAEWRGAGDLPGFVLLGLLCGVSAGLLPRGVPRIRAWLRRMTARAAPHDACARGALAGLAVGLLGLASPSILGVGYDAIASWLAGGGDGREAGLAFIVKGLAVSIALAAPLVGGVFAPSLFLGASLGAATGHLLQALWPGAGIDPAAYALVGMGAFFAGFLRTPVASVLIVFELTGDYGLVVPLMMAVAIASLLARKLSPYTLVERQLEDDGISTTEVGPDPLARRRVADAMSPSVITFPATRALAEVWPEAERLEHAMYPVVDERGFCVGVIEEAALKAAARAGQLADEVRSRTRPARVVATPDEAIDRVLLRLGSADETRCPVVESLARPRVVGFLAPSDVLRLRVRASVEGAEGPFEPLR